MNWRVYISEYFPDAKFQSPAEPQSIQNAEKTLGIALPDDLKAVYAETNGFYGHIGTNLIWSVDELLSQNLTFRKDYPDLYMPFDCLLFFGDDGSGDCFGFRILSEGVDWQTFRWDHETDNRTLYSGSLRNFIKKYGQTYFPE